MAKITAPNPALVDSQPNSATVQVRLNGDVYMTAKTLTFSRRRRPFWVVDLYAIRNTMKVAEPKQP